MKNLELVEQLHAREISLLLERLETPEPEDTATPLSAAQISETVGKGYCRATLPDEVWLKRVTAYRSFIDWKF